MKLEMQQATIGYGDTVVLRNLDLSIASGEVVALIGPNGAGKTTLLRGASGLLPLRAGKLLCDGSAISGRKPHQIAMRGVCHITEGRSVFDALTVRENLRLFCDRAAEAEGIERAVDAFPALAKRLRQVVGTMSGGEQQMVAMARAYVRRRDIVLLDEVSLGLAPLVVDEIFGFLKRLTAEGTGILLVEQYVTRALDISDRVYVLVRGSIVYSGSAASYDRSATFEHYVGVT